MPALPFLHHTEILLAPIGVMVILWAVSLLGFNMSTHWARIWLMGRA